MAIRALIVTGPYGDRMLMTNGDIFYPTEVFSDLGGTLYEFGVKPSDVALLQAAEKRGTLGGDIKNVKIGKISVKDVSDAAYNIRKGLSEKDALVVYVGWHGADWEGQSSILIGDDSLTPAQLGEILDGRGREHQLVLTQSCMDYGFGSIANERRAVLTNTSSPGSAKPGAENVIKGFMEYVGERHDYETALRKSKEDNPAFTTTIKRVDKNTGKIAVIETGNTDAAQPMLHATPYMQREKLIHYAPLTRQLSAHRRVFLDSIHPALARPVFEF